MNQISYAVWKKQSLTLSKTTLIRTTTFWLISSSVSLKFIRGNKAPFMKREFLKEIYVSSRLRNKYWVEPSAENKAAYKKQK